MVKNSRYYLKRYIEQAMNDALRAHGNISEALKLIPEGEYTDIKVFLNNMDVAIFNWHQSMEDFNNQL